MSDDSKKILKDIFHIWRYFGRRRRLQLLLLFFLMLFSVFAEVFTIGAVVPFIAVLVNPESIYSIHWLQPVLRWSNVESANAMVLPLTVVFIGTAIVAGLTRIALAWVRLKLTMGMGVQLTDRLLYQHHHAEQHHR